MLFRSKINPFFVREYEKGAQSYNSSKVVSVISHLRNYDLRSKGVGDAGTNQGDLLKELMFIILH